MKNFLSLSLLLFLPALVKAQDSNNINAIAGKVVRSVNFIGAEQIVLETNKKIYAPEETIWFKAYEIDSVTGRLTNKSKILYADLVDANDKVVHHLVLNIETGQQAGAFLSDSSLGGFYWLRAYTNNILNTNTNNIAVKHIYIVNPNITASKQFNPESNTSVKAKNPMLSFYPEGGHVISGAPSLVAVKLSNNKGEGLADSGFIKDNRNNVSAKFFTNNYGLGKFILEPSSYKTYAVFLLNDNHYDSVLMLPAINHSVAQVAITEQTAYNIKARVLLEDSIYEKEYKTFLIALHKDSVCMAAEGQGNYELNMPVSNFPAGVANILLYNKNGHLLSERDIYINKNDINVAVQTDKNNYEAREKVNLNITITDKGKPVLATVSVAVNDSRVTDSVNNFSTDSLSMFSTNNSDLVMLTQQNQIEYWRNISNLNTDNSIPDANDNLYIKGTLYNSKRKSVPHKSLTLISTNQNGLIMQDSTNAAGKFSFALPYFNTGTPFSMQVNNQNTVQENYYVVLDSAIHYNFKTPGLLKENFTAGELLNLKKTQQFYMNSILTGKGWLPDVTVKGSYNSRQTNVLPDAIIPKEILQSGRVTNVGDAVLQFSRFHVIGGYLMEGGANGFSPNHSDEPIIVMDGSRIETTGYSTVLDFLKTISTSGVDHIKILTGTAAAGYGLISGTGVIEIYSASNSTFSNLHAALKTIYPRGFDTIPKFTTPDYSNRRIKNSKNDDLRTAIYWNDNLVTDKNGSLNVNFYTADIPAIYIVTISGITANGDKIYKTVTLSRK